MYTPVVLLVIVGCIIIILVSTLDKKTVHLAVIHRQVDLLLLQSNFKCFYPDDNDTISSTYYCRIIIMILGDELCPPGSEHVETAVAVTLLSKVPWWNFQFVLFPLIILMIAIYITLCQITSTWEIARHVTPPFKRDS